MRSEPSDVFEVDDPERRVRPPNRLFADVGLSNPADTGQLIGMLTPLIYAVRRSNVDEFNTP